MKPLRSMADLLVKLYELPPLEDTLNTLRDKDIIIRRAKVPEKHIVVKWVKQHFGDAWASECEVCFSRQPVSCFIALKDKQIVGFSCYEATMKNFFGPMGVVEEYRNLGIGKGLLLCALHSMKNEGYAYAIIGGVGPFEFYKKTVNAIEIEGSTPGIYRDMLKR